MNGLIATYCLVSAAAEFYLGIAWKGSSPPMWAIKVIFLFSSVWGAFFGAMFVKGYLVHP